MLKAKYFAVKHPAIYTKLKKLKLTCSELFSSYTLCYIFLKYANVEVFKMHSIYLYSIFHIIEYKIYIYTIYSCMYIV